MFDFVTKTLGPAMLLASFVVLAAFAASEIDFQVIKQTWEFDEKTQEEKELKAFNLQLAKEMALNGVQPSTHNHLDHMAMGWNERMTGSKNVFFGKPNTQTKGE
jgi:hypothetical protein